MAVAAAVEAVPVGLAGGDLDRGGAAERGVGAFVAQSVGVVAGGDEELTGGVVADAVHGDERGGDVVEDRLDVPVEFSDLEARALANGVRPTRAITRRAVGCRGDGRAPSGSDGDLLLEGQAAELGADPVRGGVDEAVQLVRCRVRAFIAPARATRSWRRASTGPVPVLGITMASPASTARAAASASTGSDFPRRRRCWRLGRFTSTTCAPRGLR